MSSIGLSKPTADNKLPPTNDNKLVDIHDDVLVLVKPVVFASVKEIPANHWALQRPKLGVDDNAVIVVKVNGHVVGAKINPTDARGYRWIIFLVDLDDMTKVVNRFATLEENIAMSMLEAYLVQVYQAHGMIAQTAMAGNKADTADAESWTITRGAAEPYSAGHRHGWGRGFPDTIYVPVCVPNRGPTPGEEFNMMGPKVQWKPGEVLKVATWLRQQLLRAIKNDNRFTLVE